MLFLLLSLLVAPVGATPFEQMVREVYGAAPQLRTKLMPTRSAASDLVELRLDIEGVPRVLSPRIAVFLPAGNGPVDVFLTLNKCGNRSVRADERITPSVQTWRHKPHCQGVSDGDHLNNYGTDILLPAGLGLATFAEGDVAPDSVRRVQGDIRQFLRPKTGNLMLWAWALGRVARELPAVLPRVRAVYVTGHSRRGKAALLAAALEPSIAGVFPNQSGTAGTSSMKGHFPQEPLSWMTNGAFFYPWIGEPEGLSHFFAPGFNRLSRHPKRLPYDSHVLIQAIAPRVIVDFQGKLDFWAGPGSARKMLKKAAGAWGRPLVVMPANKLPALLQSPAQIVLPGKHGQGRSFWKVAVRALRALRLAR
jgi:hypothetical protein